MLVHHPAQISATSPYEPRWHWNSVHPDALAHFLPEHDRVLSSAKSEYAKQNRRKQPNRYNRYPDTELRRAQAKGS